MESYQKKFLLISPDFPPPNVGGSKVWLLNLVENSDLKFDILTCEKEDKYDEVLVNQHKIIRSKYACSTRRILTSIKSEVIYFLSINV